MTRASVVLWVVLAGCRGSGKTPASPHRMELRRLSGDTVSFVPAPGQLPYCLIYTISARGVTRQITMTRGQQSVPCPAGVPVMGLAYRIPLDEGRVKAYSFFSDHRLTAAAVSEQLVEIGDSPTLSPMNLRLPGQVVLDVEEFNPSTPGAL